MSGRDLRAFVNFHRDAIGASDPSLVLKLVDGKNTGRYKEANYEKLKAITKLKCASGLQSLQKINKLQKINEQKKEENILQQHKTCWKKEFVRLNNLYKTTLYDLELAQTGLPWQQRTDCYEELKEYNALIEDDYLTFTKSTIKPIWDLHEDIQLWLKENKHKVVKDQCEVSQVLQSVKEQQQSIMTQLKVQQSQLEGDPCVINVQDLIQNAEELDNGEDFKTGVPEEAFFLTCPYDDLKDSVLNEFELLDRRYQTHLDYLNVKYQAVLENATGGWSDEDHQHFEHILDQYSSELPNRRSLYIDRMMRELPHKSRRLIVNHEDWWFSLQSVQNQSRAVRLAWQRHRQDLVSKVKATFTDAWNEHENEKLKTENRKQQEDICLKLHQKVEHFQQQKLEAFNLKQKIEEKMKREEIEKMQMDEDREKKRRDIIHTKVHDYKARKVYEAEMRLEEERERLSEIHREMEEQAKMDAERVAFRENELRKRQEAKQILLHKQQEEQEKKENLLDKLREQVVVNVEDDPYRVLQHTEASRAHAAKPEHGHEEYELQKPLFAIHTFDVHQVTSDPRYKVEQALRNAGLHHTDYAREVLAKIKPLHPTRPDQQSSLFKE